MSEEHEINGAISRVFARRLTQLSAWPWPKGSDACMEALARLFPSMRDVLGAIPWEPRRLVHWLNESGAVTSGSKHAALFLLSIWNGEDWSQHGLKIRRRRGGVEVERRIGRFDLRDAWAAWDEDHRAAALAWLVHPFWP